VKYSIDVNGKVVEVELSKPGGAPGCYHVTVDGWHWGQIVKNLDGWFPYLTATGTWLSGDDAGVLVGMVEDIETSEVGAPQRA
jgi:hypothetical protein